MTDFEEHFEQLSPLLDDVVIAIANLRRSPYEHAAIAAMATARLSMGTILAMMRSNATDDDLSDEQKQRIMELLEKETRSVDELIQAASEHFKMQGLIQ